MVAVGRICTYDLKVMGLASYYYSTPRYKFWYPAQELNPHLQFRRLMFYPLDQQDMEAAVRFALTIRVLQTHALATWLYGHGTHPEIRTLKHLILSQVALPVCVGRYMGGNTGIKPISSVPQTEVLSIDEFPHMVAPVGFEPTTFRV